MRSSDLQSDSDLDSIRNSCDVFVLFQFGILRDLVYKLYIQQIYSIMQMLPVILTWCYLLL